MEVHCGNAKKGQVYSGWNKSRDVLGSVHPTCPMGCWWTRKLLLAPHFLGHGESKHQNSERDLNEVNFFSLLSLYSFIDQKEKSRISKDRSELCQGYFRTSGGSGGELLSTWPSESVAKCWGVVMLLQGVCPHAGQVWKAGTISYMWWYFEGRCQGMTSEIWLKEVAFYERGMTPARGKREITRKWGFPVLFNLRIMQAAPCTKNPIISANISVCGSWRKERSWSHSSQIRHAGQAL